MKKPFWWPKHQYARDYVAENHGKISSRAIARHLNEVYPDAGLTAHLINCHAHRHGIKAENNQGMPTIKQVAAEVGCASNGLTGLIRRNGWKVYGRSRQFKYVPPKTVALIKLHNSKPATRRRHGTPQSFTVAEAAAIWNSNRSRIEGAIADGRIKAERVMGELRISTTEYDRIGPVLPRKAKVAKPRPVSAFVPRKANGIGSTGHAHPWRRNVAS